MSNTPEATEPTPMSNGTFLPCYRQFIVKPARLIALLTISVVAFGAGDSIVLDTMSQELQRNYDALKKADTPPYFMAYEITDLNTRVVGATLGVLDSTQNSHNRYLDVTVRVGDPSMDNYRRARGEQVQFTSAAPVTIEDIPGALKQRMWLGQTDPRSIRAAADRLVRIKTSQQVKAADRDQSADFSKEESYVHTESLGSPQWDESKWEQTARDWSRDFRDYPDLLSSSVSVSIQQDQQILRQHRRHQSRTGPRLRPQHHLRQRQSERRHGRFRIRFLRSFHCRWPAQRGEGSTPAIKEGGHSCRRSLLKAPVAEPFVGPAILFPGRAAGVFFHEIFGHRIEGHRQKDETEGQTFTQKVGEKILPDFLTGDFDPQLIEEPWQTSTSTATTNTTMKA